MSSNGEDLSDDNKMGKDSNNDNDDGCGGDVRDLRGDNAEHWKRFEQ